MPKNKLLVPVESWPNDFVREVNDLIKRKLKGENEMWENTLVNALEQEDGQFIIGSVTPEGGLSIAARPKVHEGFSAAKTEAARLAKNYPTKKFVVMRVVHTVEAKPVQPQYNLVTSTSLF